eukprot:TRINITY_DN288_c0_g2_i1.p1 TRINITY_DN288_c0_g2~~TRINITY_DN288_c0_g2_i1.p1  ORF type:complete len:178 (-),score=45.53 TRINITY_DN288_c0_g2_i1:23-556(-)
MNADSMDYLCNFQKENSLSTQTMLNLLIYNYFWRKGLQASCNSFARDAHLEHLLTKLRLDQSQSRFLETSFKTFWQKFINKALQANNTSDSLVLAFVNNKHLTPVGEKKPEEEADRRDDGLSRRSKKIRKLNERIPEAERTETMLPMRPLPGQPGDDIFMDQYSFAQSQLDRSGGNE